MDNIYVYCISDKSIDAIPSGINNAPVRAICSKELNLIYSTTDKELKYTEENFIAHESVLEELLKKNATILPFRFGTCMDEKIGEEILEEKYQPFMEHIDRLRGKIEVSIRALWDYAGIKTIVLSDINIPQVTTKNEKILNYFNKRMKEYKTDESVKNFAEKESGTIHGQLLCSAVEGKYTLMKTNNMFFNGVYLIEKTKINNFQSAYRKVAKDYGMYRFIMTGPWPPYNFCNITI